MLIEEKICHGAYHNERTAEIADTYPAFVKFLQGSPYAGPAAREDNEYVKKAYADLMATGKGEFGWTRYARRAPELTERVIRALRLSNDSVRQSSERIREAYLEAE